ncbi:MAG: aquaporin [Acidimicrobiia bacterium]|nr:aquaporin [Acidimicrobiia bacterium]NNC74102.1 aquaporin [Acidimicrobiia bacterium]
MSMGVRRTLAEFLGTFILVFVGGLAILSAAAVGGDGSLVVIAFGWGLALLAALYAVGEISGGHFNPAVTLGALFDNRVDMTTLISYWAAQSGGAVVAGFLLLLASSQEQVAEMATVPLGAGTTSAFFIELALTAVFVMVILKVTTSEEFGSSALVAISLTLVGINFAASPLTGASVNPARTLATAIAGAEGTDIWIYLTAPFLGAIVGWALYKLVTTGEVDVSVDELVD